MPGAEKLRLRVHPLFLCIGVLTAFTGDLLLFLLAVIAAFEHECAHAFAARRFGFRLDTLTLMPYGAVLSGDLTGMDKKQELWVLAAGPLCSGATWLFFVALWWLYPEAYPYTEAAARVSFSLFAVNLLPAYPLDGGRMLRLALSPLGKRRARILTASVSFFAAAGIFAYFIVSCFSSPAFTALAFSVLLLIGAAAGLKEGAGRYGRVSFSREKSFARGVEERRICISVDCTLQRAMRYLSAERYLVFVLFRGGEFEGELTEEEFLSALNGGDYARKLGEFLLPA